MGLGKEEKLFQHRQQGTGSSVSPAPETRWILGFGRSSAGGGRSILSHLDVPDADLRGAALHVAVVAAAGAALHLHAGRPHHEVGVGAVHHGAGDLEDHRPRLALGEDSWLGRCQGVCGGPGEREEGGDETG